MTNVEAECLQLAKIGDQEAFTKIVETYQNPVYNLCYRMLGERGEAEDAAQEAFLRAYAHLDRYETDRSFRTWVLSIASNHCIDLFSSHFTGSEFTRNDYLASLLAFHPWHFYRGHTGVHFCGWARHRRINQRHHSQPFKSKNQHS